MALLNRSPLSDTFGVVIRGTQPRTDLADVSAAEMLGVCAEAGAILFRGFDVEMGRFEAFTSRFLRQCVVNGNQSRANVVAERQIQTVNGGCDPIPLHAEMAYSPMRPDLLFFHCLSPPRSGAGETLLCDGVDAWRRMAPATRQRFEDERIRYRFHRSPMIGAQLGGHHARWAGDDRVRGYQQYDDGTADLDYVVAAAPPARGSAAPAFANSVIVEASSASFEHGAEITRELRLELFQLTTRLAVKVVWEAGDILMIDNSRVMHGRNRIRPDDGRTIALRMGWP